MAKKKVITTETTEDDTGELVLETGGAADEAGLDASMAAMDELRALGGDDVLSWTVVKVPTKPGERGGYCARYTSGDLSLDTIRETFGGGKYRVRGTDNAGKWVPGASKTIEVMELPRAPQPIAPANTPAMGEIAQLIQAMRPSGEGNSQTMQLLMGMIQAQGEMFKAIMNRPEPQHSSLAETLALIKATRPEGGDSAVNMLVKGLEMGQKLGGGETGMLDIAREGLSALAPLIAQQAAQPAPQRVLVPRAPAPVVALPAGAAPAAPVSQPVPENNPMLQQLAWLRAQVNTLVIQAMRDRDPELYALVLLDNLPPFITEEQLLERLSAPDAVAQLAALDGRVTAHAAWFEAFRQAILAQFDDENTGPADAANDGGENLA